MSLENKLSIEDEQFKELIAKGWTKSQVETLITAFEVVGELEEKREIEYTDNFRYARARNQEEIMAYEKQAGEGCCGSSDEIYWDRLTGTIILFGYNFGH